MNDYAGTDEFEVAEAEVVEVDEAAAPGHALEVRPASNQVLMPLDTEQVVAGMKAYQELLVRLLEESDYQKDGDRKYPKKSAWRKIARAFNLSVVKVSMTVSRDADGNPVRAEAVYRAIAPNGQSQDGDGYCSVTEPRFQSEKGKQKVENDLRATATTRAKNRAISDLVGMGEVSAEEVTAGDSGNGGAQMPLATEQENQTVSTALCYLLPPKEAEATYNAVTKLFEGKMYGAVARAIVEVVAARKLLDEAAAATKES